MVNFFTSAWAIEAGSNVARIAINAVPATTTFRHFVPFIIAILLSFASLPRSQ